MSPERWVSSISRDDLQRVVEILHGFACPWYVSGGWAIDLFLGRVTRKHEDLEIGIARRDQGYLHAHLADWQLHMLAPESADIPLVPWLPGGYLELPIHQIVARRHEGSPREFEFFLNEIWDGEWRFRRQPSIRCPIEESYVWTEHGIPVIAPEIQLLYKSSWHRPKDEHDFQSVLGYLSPSQRSWLKRALEVYRPRDPWLNDLARSAPC